MIHTRLAPVLSACLLSGLVSAQNWLPHTPSSLGTDDRLDFTKSPVLQGVSGHPRPIWAVGAYKMPSDPPGTWTVSFTVRALRGFGNPGFSGMLLAKWTPGAANPLVLTSQAAAANDAFVDYNMVLEPVTRDASGKKIGGRYGTFDRFAFVNGNLTLVGPFLAARADDTKAFGKAKAIAGLQGLTDFADPVTAHVGGKLKLIYCARGKDASGRTIDGVWMDDLLTPDTAPKVAGHRVLVARPEGRDWIAHAPIPLNGADGETKGLLLCMAGPDFAWSDVYFAADLDPATPSVFVHGDQNQFLSGGGSAGGELFYHTRANQNLPLLMDTAFLLGDTCQPGENCEVNVTAYSKPGTRALVAVVAGLSWLPKPIQLPGFLGQLGVAPMVKIGSATVDGDHSTHFSIPVPTAAKVRGLDLNVQGLVSFTDRSGRTRQAMTNTAQIRVR